MDRGIRRNVFAAVISAWFSLPLAAQSEAPPGVKPFRVLRDSVPHTIATTDVIEVRAKATSADVRTMRGVGRLPRDRRPELAADRLVIVLVDADRREQYWQIVQNPYLIRVEVPGPTGTLSGAIVERADAELLLTLPAIPSVTRIQIYEPRWNGTEFILESARVIDLAGRK